MRLGWAGEAGGWDLDSVDDRVGSKCDRPVQVFQQGPGAKAVAGTDAQSRQIHDGFEAEDGMPGVAWMVAQRDAGESVAPAAGEVG